MEFNLKHILVAILNYVGNSPIHALNLNDLGIHPNSMLNHRVVTYHNYGESFAKKIV